MSSYSTDGDLINANCFSASEYGQTIIKLDDNNNGKSPNNDNDQLNFSTPPPSTVNLRKSKFNFNSNLPASIKHLDTNKRDNLLNNNPSVQFESQTSNHNKMPKINKSLPDGVLGADHETAIVSANIMDEYYRRESVPDIQFNYEEFVNRITCHGIQDWYSAQSKPSFMFWGVLFFAASGVLAYSIYKCFNDFYTEPIITSISVTPLNSIPFPDVYICPTSFLNATAYELLDPEAKRRASFFNRADGNSAGILGLKEVISDLLPGLGGGGNIENINSPQKPAILVKQQQEIMDSSLKISSFIPECRFYGRKARKNGNNKEANIFDCSDLIEQKLDKDYGVCYLINLSQTNQYLPTKGLSVVIDLLTEQIWPQPHSAIDTSATLADGIFLTVQSSFHPVEYRRTLVGPGTHTQVSLQAKEETFVSVSAFSKTPQLCVKEGEVQFEVLNVAYSREACQFDCVQQLVLQSGEGEEKCILPIDVSAVQQRHWNLTKWCSDYEPLVTLDTEEYALCASKCHRACNEKSYSIAGSSHRIPSKFFRNKYKWEDPEKTAASSIGEQDGVFGKRRRRSPDVQYQQSKQRYKRQHLIDDSTTKSAKLDTSLVFEGSGFDVGADSSAYATAIPTEFIPVSMESPSRSTGSDIASEDSNNRLLDINRWEDNVIVLDIAFDRLELTSITQSEAMTVMSLLGNLGGVAGLWLGASLFTVVQCLVFSVKLCMTFCFKPENS